MKVKIAVASTDGKVINEHFGRAENFHIFEVQPGSYRYLETRSVNSCCNSGSHSNALFDAVAETLKDCVAIITAKIGDGAEAYMESKGFTVFEAPYAVNAVLDKVIEDNLLALEEAR